MKRAVALCVVALLTTAGDARLRAQSDVDPQIAQLLTRISEERLAALLEKLASFETRSTLSSDNSTTRGIGAARQWIFDEMKQSSPRLQVSFDTYQLAPSGRITRQIELRNVVAVLPGRSPRRVYISGHYDTVARAGGQISSNAVSDDAAARPPQPPAGGSASPPQNAAPLDNFAPGVNDDGSGTALVMELARVFGESGLDFDATLVFICVAGEEQGLVGSRLHAQKAKADAVRIDGDLNNDIVGNDTAGNGIVDGASVRLYSEGPEDSPSRSLARFVQRQAARYVPSHRVRLMAMRDRVGRGGDHSGFNASGFAAVGFRESRENFTRQHSVRDTFEGVSVPYLARNARVNAAAAAALAIAPPAPGVLNERNAPTIDRGKSGYDAHLRWTASPGAAGYKVFWRETWQPDWQREVTLGNVTEYTLPDVSIDDYIFGVAAVDAAGHESLVAPFVSAAPRSDAPIKLVGSSDR